MKFEQMQYARPDFDAARETFASLRARIAAAPDAQAQLEAFREFETLSRHISTNELSSIWNLDNFIS